jgi:hypothetical protein
MKSAAAWPHFSRQNYHANWAGRRRKENGLENLVAIGWCVRGMLDIKFACENQNFLPPPLLPSLPFASLNFISNLGKEEI